jgi:hypothetical protein
VLDRTDVVEEQIEINLEAEETRKQCEFCGEPFTPRASSGGKPQRFCSTDCRQQSNDGKRSNKANKANKANKDVSSAQPPPTALAEYCAARAAEEAKVFAFWEKHTVIRHQPAVAVYINAADGLTIRQEREPDEDEDTLIAIGRDNINEFVNRVLEICADNGIPIPIRRRTQNGS